MATEMKLVDTVGETGEERVSRPILVVEDDAGVRRMIQWALEDEGLPVEVAADGREAVEAGEKKPPALVILDFALPDIDGEAVARRLREAHGETVPIVTITAADDPAEKAARVGARCYLRKPFDIRELIGAVRQALPGDLASAADGDGEA